jgi:hypothetical protein
MEQGQRLSASNLFNSVTSITLAMTALIVATATLRRKQLLPECRQQRRAVPQADLG